MEDQDLFRAAQALKNSIATKALFNALRDKYTQIWLSSDPKDVDVRNDAYHMMRAIADLQGQIDALAGTPDVVAFNRRLKGR
jgi:hypothetical protein